MNREQYKHSNTRLILLLVQFAIIAYTIASGDKEARLLAFFILPLWLISVNTWVRR